MSHASGAVRFMDGTIMYFEYDGTSNCCIPALWLTQEEVNQHWRSEDEAVFSKMCSCEPVATWEPVTIMVTYGDGDYWPGLACRSCMVLTKHNRYDDNTETGYVAGFRDGEPSWSPWKV
jgi:hypothetical protein